MSDGQPRWPVSTVAVLFECLLGVAGLVIIWLGGLHRRHAFIGDLTENLSAIVTGVVASAPLVLAAFAMLASTWGPLQRLRQFVMRHVVPWFRTAGVTDLALVAGAAGVGEELLFRGAIQTGLIDWWGEEQAWLAVLSTALFFGLLHWATTSYAILATIMGLILGVLFVVTGNILVPVTVHALYDFMVLLRLVRMAT